MSLCGRPNGIASFAPRDIALGVLLSAALAAPAAVALAPSQEQLRKSFGQVPMHFEANAGQADPAVLALARGAGYALFLSADEAVLSLSGAERSQPLRLRWLGGRAPLSVSTEARLPGESHYYRGSVRSAWREHVPHHARVRYAGVYPGVDLVFHGNQRELEYDFEVAPGADARAIRLRFDGARRLRTGPGGELLLDVDGKQVVQHAPVAYQDVDGRRRTVTARYEVRGREVRFALSGHDPRHALVIDPVLSYSTYLGGSGFDYGAAIAVGPDGSAYLSGATESLDFPVHSPSQGSLAGAPDLFVTRLAPAGNALVFSTYLGSSGAEDYDTAIALDAAGNAYVAGSTGSSDFPTLNPFQTFQGLTDAVLSKLSPAGTLIYSTYLGGSGSDLGRAIAVNAAGEAVVTGSTNSSNYPLLIPNQNALHGPWDAFVTRLAASGSALVQSTYLGGNAEEFGSAVAFSPSGAVLVGGRTYSANFPLVNSIQGDQGLGDMFVARLVGATLSFSTYLGGSGDDEEVRSLAVDGAGAAYVFGWTSSSDFPTVNPVQTHQGGTEFTVTKLDLSVPAIVYSTYVGGSNGEWRGAGAVARDGSACLFGDANYISDFPSVAPLAACHPGEEGDAVLACLAPNGGRYTFATCLGGATAELGLGIALGSDAAIYVAGTTDSSDFPTLNPFQANQGGIDVFAAKIQGYLKGDQNRDGRTDLLLHNNVTGENQAWLMDGTTRLSAATLTPAAASLAWQISGADDFNADGHTDLLFWNSATGATEFWLMNGTVRVGSPVALGGTPALPWRPSATADFDRDGRPDLVWRNGASCGVGTPPPGCQAIRIWVMNGTAKVGEITPKPGAAADANWEIVGAVDGNADTQTDLLWYNSTSGKIVYWWMKHSADAGECSTQGLAAPCLYRTLGQFTNPANAGANNWKVLATGDYGVGAGGLPGTKDLVWRNASSGRFVVWHMDNAGNRTLGTFTTPLEPSPNPTNWTIAGPR